MTMGSPPEMTLCLAKGIMQAVMHSSLTYFILALILMDFITGITKAFIQGIYESKVGINGIVRHALVFLLIVFFKFFSRLFGIQLIGQGLTILFAFNYIVSIIENVEGAGVEFPEVIKSKFAQMQRNAERKIDEKFNLSIKVHEKKFKPVDTQMNEEGDD